MALDLPTDELRRQQELAEPCVCPRRGCSGEVSACCWELQGYVGDCGWVEVRGRSRTGCPWAGDRAGDTGHSAVLTREAARASSPEPSQLLGTTESSLRGGGGLKPQVQSSECSVREQSPTGEELLGRGRGKAGESGVEKAARYLL